MKITKTIDPRDYEQVCPNFIYNRFDLFCQNGEFEAVKLGSGKNTRVIEYKVTGEQAELGLWLVSITTEELEELLLHIKRNHPAVKTVTSKNAVIPYGKAKEHNHFRILFPDTVEEMESRISSKSRAKLRKKLRRAENDFGPMTLLEYDKEHLPDEIVDAFFRFKLATRKRKYNMTPREYLERYHVSHCYVVKFGETIGAIRFSCEQCPIVYGENFTYNPEMSDYSLGRFIFVHHLNRMVEKKHTELFFAGGDYEYKTHYGSIEETLYDCTVTFKDVDWKRIEYRQTLKGRVKGFLKKKLPPSLVQILKKVRDKVRHY